MLGRLARRAHKEGPRGMTHHSREGKKFAYTEISPDAAKSNTPGHTGISHPFDPYAALIVLIATALAIGLWLEFENQIRAAFTTISG